MNKILATWRILRPWVKITIIIGLLLLLLPILTYQIFKGLVSFEVADELPTKQELAQIKNPYGSELYAADGQIIGRFYAENRSPLKPEDLNEFYKSALLATEDIRFFDHDGVDTRSLFRVIFKTILLQKEASGGGSTLTQQLAKNLYPRRKYRYFSTVFNKFREMEIARRLEEIYSKEEILVLYSNTISFGERAFGLPTAARRFFNKTPKELTLEESSLLVGLLKATSSYSPRRFPERAKQRRNVVFAQLARYEFIDDSTKVRLSDLPIQLDYQSPSEHLEFAGYFKQHVKQEFNKWNAFNTDLKGTSYNLYRDGLKIYTTIDHNLQIAAEQVMKDHMSKLQNIFETSWKGGNLYGKNASIVDDQVKKHPTYKALLAAGKTEKEAHHQFTLKSKKELWTWEGRETKMISTIDSLKHYLSLLHGSVLAIEPKSGAIKAWVGGNDYSRFQYDHIMGARQVGSTFKPIVYLAALEAGIEPCDQYENSLRTYSDYQNWTPRNAGGKYGGYLTVQEALMQSTNTVSVQVLFDTGISEAIDMSRKLGVNSRLNEVPSIVLGTSDITLYEMVKAYSTLANDGYRVDPTAITKITDKDGKILFDIANYRDIGEQVVDPTYVKTLNGMLQNATLFGTGRRLYSQYDIKFPISGKTGTTQNQSDGWFIGYNPDLAIGAWVGTEDRRIHFRNISTGSGGRTALPLVGGLFEYAKELNYIKTTEVDSQYFVVCEPLLEEETDSMTLPTDVALEENATPTSKTQGLPLPPSNTERRAEPSLPSPKADNTPPSTVPQTQERRTTFPAPPPRASKRTGKLGKRFTDGTKSKTPATFQSLIRKEFDNVETEKAKRLKAFNDARRKWELQLNNLKKEANTGGN